MGGWRIASLGSTWPMYNIATPVSGETVQLDRLRSAFPGGGYRVWVRDGMAAAEEELLSAGFRLQLDLPAFVRDLSAAGPAPDARSAGAAAGYGAGRAQSRKDIEECVWGDRISLWLDVAVRAAFPDPWQVAREANRRFYQARYGDRLVATGQSLVHQGVAGVYAIWTAEPHRSRGLASELLRLICADAAAAGATHATLQAEPGRLLYTRAGFKRQYRYRVYGEKDDGHA